MKPWLLSLWNDPAKFAASCRAIIATVGGMYAAGLIPVHGLPWWVGLLIMGMSQAIPAGQKNGDVPSLIVQLNALSPEERTRVAGMLKP